MHLDSLLEISRDVDVEGGVITSSHGATRYKVPGQHVPCECDNAAERAREQNKRAGGGSSWLRAMRFKNI